MAKKNNGSQSDITKGILFFYDWLDAMSILNPKEFKEMVMAMADFQRNGTELPRLEGTSKYIAPLIFNQLRTRMEKANAGRAGALSKWGVQEELDGGDIDECAIAFANGSESGTDGGHAISSRASTRASTSNEASTSLRESANAHAHAREEKKGYGDFENVLLTDGEYTSLCEKFGKSAISLINNLSLKMRSKGYKFEDHYATLILWAQSDGVCAEEDKSYDTDEFFEASLMRSYGEFEERYGRSEERSEDKK